MNDIAPNATAIAPAVPELTKEQLQEAVEKPLRLLPPDWRAIVWNIWAKWSDLLRTQLSLCASLREWIAEDGLTLAEAKEAFAEVNRPSRRAAIRFPGDVLAELAAEVARVVARRRAAEHREQERRRRDSDASVARADYPAILAAMTERKLTIERTPKHPEAPRVTP